MASNNFSQEALNEMNNAPWTLPCTSGFTIQGHPVFAWTFQAGTVTAVTTDGKQFIRLTMQHEFKESK